MLVNAKQHFPAPSAAFRRLLHSLLKLIIKNNVLCFDPPTIFFDLGFRTSGPFCMGENFFKFLFVKSMFDKIFDRTNRDFKTNFSKLCFNYSCHEQKFYQT
jgi:hypothetical protein